MVNGEQMKEQIKYELEHIEDVDFEIKNGSLEITSMAVDMIYDEILGDLQDEGVEPEHPFNCILSHREYFKEHNILRIRVQFQRTLTLYNIGTVMQEAITETYYDLCNYARDNDVFVEPEDSILL